MVAISLWLVLLVSGWSCFVIVAGMWLQLVCGCSSPLVVVSLWVYSLCPWIAGVWFLLLIKVWIFTLTCFYLENFSHWHCFDILHKYHILQRPVLLIRLLHQIFDWRRRFLTLCNNNNNTCNLGEGCVNDKGLN